MNSDVAGALEVYRMTTCIVCKGASHGMKTCGAGACQHVHLHAVMADGCACDACVGIGPTRMASIKEESKTRTRRAQPLGGPILGRGRA